MEQRPKNPNMPTRVERLNAHAEWLQRLAPYFCASDAGPLPPLPGGIRVEGQKLRAYEGSPLYYEVNSLAHVISPEELAEGVIPETVDNFDIGAMLAALVAQKEFGNVGLLLVAKEINEFTSLHEQKLRANRDYDFEAEVDEDITFRASTAMDQIDAYDDMLAAIFATSRRTEIQQQYFRLGFGFVLFAAITAMQKTDQADMAELRDIADNRSVDWDMIARVIETVDEHDKHSYRPLDD